MEKIDPALFARIADSLKSEFGIRLKVNSNDQILHLFLADGQIGKCYEISITTKKFKG